MRDDLLAAVAAVDGRATVGEEIEDEVVYDELVQVGRYAEVAEKLGAARVQMIGKLLIFWRPADESERQDPDEAARLAILSMKTASVAGKKEAPSAPAKRTPLKAVAKPAKKVASKKPGEKKKATSPIPVRSRSKKNRVTKKGAGSRS